MAETTKPTAKETTRKAPGRVESYDIAQSNDTLDLAKDLAKFIKDNKLSTQVQGKEFVNVEGWQYAGSRLGIVPIVEHVINVGSEAEIKYQAKVTLFDLRSQHTVGAGFAICSNKESGRKFYQEFAIASMAQTRAVGKAYRNILAWIIRAAGYEPTPAEEMEYTGNVPVSTAPALATAVLGTEGNLPAQAVMRAVTTTEQAAGAPALVQYATAAQKEEIIHLLGHPLITKQEKTKMLLNINRLDEERATQAIAKLRQAIEDREDTTNVAGPAESAGNETGGPSGTPAASSSDAPAASAGSGPAMDELRTELKSLLGYLNTALTGSNAERDGHLASVNGMSRARLTELLAHYKALAPPYATVSQKEEIIRLLNHPVITRQEKTKMLLNINRLSEERATEAEAKLRKTIQDREGSTSVAA